MIIISIGANLDIHDKSTKYQTCQQALDYLEKNHICQIIQTSDWYQTTAWPDSYKPAYINAVAQVEPYTTNPRIFLQELHKIEAYFGRERNERWGDRTLDLDLLIWNDYTTENHDTLQDIAIPHPRILERYFVLIPLAQIAPNLIIPNTQLTCKEYADKLDYNPDDIQIYKKASLS
ncbi:MAG: 2-amino-4-hydroxy-6-hydroxymethyldihydropteridine diphosphokinase [Alphaproteobacteria bacterium]